jgi:hypothetical protein
VIQKGHPFKGARIGDGLYTLLQLYIHMERVIKDSREKSLLHLSTIHFFFLRFESKGKLLLEL